MTIAVALKYPWGDLNRLPPPNSKIPEAVILASDSRISRKEPSGYLRAWDVGTKLFKLTRDAAGVYAGMSQAGELCFAELMRRLSKQKMRTSARSAEIAEETFKAVYRHQIAQEKLEPDDAPLYVLIGACDRRGQAELYYFSYRTGFKAEAITDARALGWQHTVDRFRQLLTTELRDNVERELSLRERFPQVPMASLVPMPIKAEHVMILINSILFRVIESGSDPTIGGMLQCGLVTAEGVSLPEISYSPDPTNEGPGWTRATAKPHELRTVTGTPGVFGSYDLTD